MLQENFWWLYWYMVEVHVGYMVETSSWWVGTYMRCIVDDVGTCWWVIVYVYLMHDCYIFGECLMHSLIVQVGAWLMHLFMVQVDYRLFGHVIVRSYLYMFTAWLMHLFIVQVEVQFNVWYILAWVISTGCYRLITGWLVQVYNSISHSDSVTMVPSFYLYTKVVGRVKDK